MGYLAVWKVLEEMVADFKKKGAAVPTNIINDLKSAKIIIRILEADPSCGANAQKINEYLTSVESYLISEGQRRFGQAYVDDWLRRADEASRKTSDKDEEETRFISGVRREQKWIRLTPSDELPLEKMKALAKKSNLQFKIQNDEYLIVSGTDTALKDFVKKIAAKYKPNPKKEH